MLKFKFFNIPNNSNEASNELNAFISTHKILKVDKTYDSSLNSWVFCVEYVTTSTKIKTGRKTKLDYDKLLSTDDEKIKYNIWKLARNDICAETGKPAYEIFINSEVYELCKKENVTVSDFLHLETYNQEKIDKYAEKLIALYNKYINNKDVAKYILQGKQLSKIKEILNKNPQQKVNETSK